MNNKYGFGLEKNPEYDEIKLERIFNCSTHNARNFSKKLDDFVTYYESDTDGINQRDKNAIM